MKNLRFMFKYALKSLKIKTYLRRIRHVRRLEPSAELAQNRIDLSSFHVYTTSPYRTFRDRLR